MPCVAPLSSTDAGAPLLFAGAAAAIALTPGGRDAGSQPPRVEAEPAAANNQATAILRQPQVNAEPAATTPAAADADSTAPATRSGQGLVVRTGRDGSFSLWSEAFGEGFHSGRGALRETRETFLNPSELERFQRGSRITVLEVCVGTGCNLAVLLEACTERGLQLDWIGLELDREPLRLALSQPAFRQSWQPETLAILEAMQRHGGWQTVAEAGYGDAWFSAEADPAAGSAVVAAQRGCHSGQDQGVAAHPAASAGHDAPAAVPGGDAIRAGQVPPGAAPSRGRMLWGDARQTLQQLRQECTGRIDLIWHDAFSPQRCPQLWSVEFLADLTRLLRPQGRWISYCSAAAVREALRLAGLQLAALQPPAEGAGPVQAWSGGSLASPTTLPASPLWRALSPMEQDHLASSAAELYRDPTGLAHASTILADRQQAQAQALANGSRGSSSAWRRRWGVRG